LERGRALEVLPGCNDLSAELAERYGYINRALPADELTPFVEKLAHRIASFPVHTIAHVKTAVDIGAFSSMAEGLLVEAHESDLEKAGVRQIHPHFSRSDSLRVASINPTTER
jgi:enoyl-CoA hydratase/carnithine racemase